MTVIATEQGRFSAVVKHEYEPSTGITRELVTANEAGAKTYVVGTVLGKVTATGKYKILEASAADGSQNFAGVVIGDSLGYSRDISVAAATDTKVLVIARGPAKLSKSALVFGASVDTQAEYDAIYAQMAAVGIVVADTK